MKPLLLLACVGLPVSLSAEGGLPNQPYIYIEGKSEMERPADMVTLQFDLVARNPDQTKANQEVQAKASQILSLLNEKKIAQHDVIAEDLKSEPQYEDEERSSSRQGKIIGYRVTRSFEAKVRDVVIFPKLINELLAFGGVEFSTIDSVFAVSPVPFPEIRQNMLGAHHDSGSATTERIVAPDPMQYRLAPVSVTQSVHLIYLISPVK